jgi:serine/threonine protein kinase
LKNEIILKNGTSECAIKKFIMEESSPEKPDLNLEQSKELKQKVFEKEIAFLWFLGQSKYFPRMLGFNVKSSAIVMRLYKFGSLKDFLSTNNRIGNPLILRILREVISGIKFMHDNDITHNDIKPGNILMDKDSSGQPSAVLSDFGNAMVLEGSSNQKVCNFKTDDIFSISVNYSSPESIIRSQGKVIATGMTFDDFKSNDIYSFAGIIYECLTGKCPWHEEKKTDDIIRQVKSGNSPVLLDDGIRRMAEDSYMQDVIHIMYECYKKNMKERPRASEILIKLNSFPKPKKYAEDYKALY